MDIEQEELIKTALDYVRCGIGGNHSRESFSERMDEIYTPFKRLIDGLVAENKDLKAENESLKSLSLVKLLEQKDSVIVKQEEANEWLRAENARLQAIIDEANAQEPVAITNGELGSKVSTLDRFIDAGQNLYTAPIPAQQSTAMPEGWKITKIDNGYVIKDRAGLDVTIVNGRASSGLTYPWEFMQNFLDDLLSNFNASKSPAVAGLGDIQLMIDRVRKWGVENTGNEPSVSCFHHALDELVVALIQSPRITEQDAAQIILSFHWFAESFKSKYFHNPSFTDWHKQEGQKVLNKLNNNQ